MEHEKHMKRCYELAVRAGKKGFDTFGAVLVHNGQAIEEAENTAGLGQRNLRPCGIQPGASVCKPVFRSLLQSNSDDNQFTAAVPACFSLSNHETCSNGRTRRSCE